MFELVDDYNAGIDDLIMIVNTSYFTDCRWNQEEICKSELFNKTLSEELSKCFKLFSMTELMAPSIPMKHVSFFEEYQIPPMPVEDVVIEKYKTLFEGEFTNRLRGELIKVLMFKRRTNAVLKMFMKECLHENKNIELHSNIMQLEVP
jgi:hypothetical protein